MVIFEDLVFSKSDRILHPSHARRISMMQWFHKRTNIAGETTSTICHEITFFLLCSNKSMCNQSNMTSGALL